MIGRKKLSAGGRGLLVVGAALLLVSLYFFKWFTIGGTQTQLPSGTYTAVQSTDLLNALAGGPYAWAGLAWMFVSAIVAVGMAAAGRRTRHFGTSGILILLLYAALLLVAANLLNQQAGAADASVTVTYGFVAALAGAALIETGGRLPSPVPTRPRAPSIEIGRQRA